jgi:Domain of unknown function (DUF4396)
VSAVVLIALAADTVSIAIMELIDNLTIILVPGALEAGLGDMRFWLPLLGASSSPGRSSSLSTGR